MKLVRVQAVEEIQETLKDLVDAIEQLEESDGTTSLVEKAQLLAASIGVAVSSVGLAL